MEKVDLLPQCQICGDQRSHSSPRQRTRSWVISMSIHGILFVIMFFCFAGFYNSDSSHSKEVHSMVPTDHDAHLVGTIAGSPIFHALPLLQQLKCSHSPLESSYQVQSTDIEPKWLGLWALLWEAWLCFWQCMECSNLPWVYCTVGLICLTPVQQDPFVYTATKLSVWTLQTVFLSSQEKTMAQC